MTYANTTLLGLNQPTTGSESGVWGDDVNNGLTQLVELTIAGTNNITQDSDITLAVSNGNNASTFTSTATNSTVAQYYILNCTGARTAARNIIAPASSRSFLVTNGTTGGYAITIKKTAGTGVSIAAGETAVVFYNTVSGDYAKAVSTTTLGTVTTGTWNATTIGIAYGGTGQTTASAAFNALSPITTTGDLIIGNGTNSATRLAIGTNGYVLTSNGTTASWQATTGGVTSFQTSLSGLTPSTSTTGAITLAGTLGATSGGTSQSTYTTGDVLYASGTNTLSKLAIGSTSQVLTVVGGVPAWATASGGVTKAAAIAYSMILGF